MADAGQVLVVGSINVDLVVRAAHLPAPGQTVTGGVFARHQGGKGANQAVAAARAGATVTMVGAVGDDEYGRSALDDLQSAGVDVSRIAVMSGELTGLALIAVDERGANQIVVAPGANAALGAAAIESALAGYEPRPGSVVALSFELAVRMRSWPRPAAPRRAGCGCSSIRRRPASCRRPSSPWHRSSCPTRARPRP
jgi:ribokinase